MNVKDFCISHSFENKMRPLQRIICRAPLNQNTIKSDLASELKEENISSYESPHWLDDGQCFFIEKFFEIIADSHAIIRNNMRYPGYTLACFFKQ